MPHDHQLLRMKRAENRVTKKKKKSINAQSKDDTSSKSLTQMGRKVSDFVASMYKRMREMINTI
jgi:hypothetical protein